MTISARTILWPYGSGDHWEIWFVGQHCSKVWRVSQWGYQGIGPSMQRMHTSAAAAQHLNIHTLWSTIHRGVNASFTAGDGEHGWLALASGMFLYLHYLAPTLSGDRQEGYESPNTPPIKSMVKP